MAQGKFISEGSGVAADAAGPSPFGSSPQAVSPVPASVPNAEIPPYPFWQADDVEAAFGADLQRYVSRADAYEIQDKLRKEADICSALFFQGGKLSDHGLQWRPEIAAQRPMQTLRALLGSFAPPHEAKTATVALALHHWCEPITKASA